MPSTPKDWSRDSYLVSTDSSKIQPLAVNRAFASDDITFTQPMDIDILRTMLNNSMCFGLYTKNPESNGSFLISTSDTL